MYLTLTSFGCSRSCVNISCGGVGISGAENGIGVKGLFVSEFIAVM